MACAATRGATVLAPIRAVCLEDPPVDVVELPFGTKPFTVKLPGCGVVTP